jgi:hypothetical protein
MQAIERTRASQTEYRSTNTMIASADELLGSQRRRIIGGGSFALHTADSSATREWVYPTTCDVRGWNVAGPQIRYQAVVLRGYSDHTCADGWKRLPLAVHGWSQLELERGHLVAQGHVRHSVTLKLGSRKHTKQVALP